MKYIVRFRRFVLVTVFLIVAGGAVVAQQQTLIALPPVTHLALGESATLDAEITCAQGNCSAFEIVLTYDPAIIQVESISLGNYLGADTIIPKRSVEDGRITLVAAAMGVPSQQSSVLFSVVVTGIGEGTTYILPEVLVSWRSTSGPLVRDECANHCRGVGSSDCDGYRASHSSGCCYSAARKSDGSEFCADGYRARACECNTDINTNSCALHDQ